VPNGDQQNSRRKFLISGALALASAVLDNCSSLAVSSEPLKLSLSDYPSLKYVGGSAQLSISGMKLIAVRRGDNDIVVFNRRCTHRGCSVQFNNDRFECPCHGSVYHADGSVLNGPAVRALEKFKVSFNQDEGFFYLRL